MGMEATVKARLGLFAAIALASLSMSIYAQAPYQRTCRDVRIQGTTLSAVCAREHGRGEQPTALNVAHCHGDIRNLDGQLQCTGGQPVPPPRQGGRRFIPVRDIRHLQVIRRRVTDQTSAGVKSRRSASVARDSKAPSTRSKIGSPTRPTARNASGCNIASAKSTRSASAAGAVERVPAPGPAKEKSPAGRIS